MRISLPAFLVSLALLSPLSAALSVTAAAEERHVRSTAHAVPKETTSEESGYFSILEGRDGNIYLGTAKYGSNAYLVRFSPAEGTLRVVVDCRKEIGAAFSNFNADPGFAAQAKIHTRNNLGESGKIYFGTKQGYPREGETRSAYPGGYPLVYDPRTGRTRVYDIPVKHHGIISIVPDEARGLAYLSTCDDARPIESTHFVLLNLETGKYRRLLDCRHLYAFLVLDHRGRAYHPVLGGKIARYDPASDTLEQLAQTIDGAPPTPDSRLADPHPHPINWEVSPDRRTLYAVPMQGNALYAYDLTSDSREALAGRKLGELLPGAAKTDCRALCVAPNGTVWAGIAAHTAEGDAGLRLVSYTPGAPRAVDHGRVVIANPEYTRFTSEAGEPRRWHHGVSRLAGGELAPRYHIMGICAAAEGTIYFTTLYPFTLHAWKPESQ